MLTVLPSALRLHQLLVLAAVVVPAIVFVVAGNWNRGEVTREQSQSVVRTTAALHEHARKVFDTVDLALARVDDRIRRLTWAEIAAPETSDFLRELKHPLEQTVSIWVADRNGVVVAGSQPWDPNARIADRDFFKAHVEQDAGTYISLPFTGRATQTPSFAMSRRRSTLDGLFDGTIHIALSPDYFARFYQETAPPDGHSATLLRKDGAILVRDPPAETKNGAGPVLKLMADDIDRGSGSAVSQIDGSERFYAFRRVAPYPVYVVFATDVASALAAWRGNLMLYGMVAIAASLTLLLVSGLALRRFKAEQLALQRLNAETHQRLVAEQKLRQAQKMESIGQLTGGIAHDFNNLLAVIIGNLELAQKRLVPDPRISRLLDVALQGAQRGASLTQRLLAFARLQDLAPDVTDVPVLVHNMMDLMRRSIGNSIEIRTDFAENLPPVQVDPNQLELTLLNLAVNARDAMPGGGAITISAREERVTGANTLGLSPGSYVCIRVEDAGAGMDEATLQRATDPFFTTKGVGKGTGLGLSMAHGFAVQSGGTLRLRSKPGTGTTAEVWLPRSGDAVAAQIAAEVVETATKAPGRFRILLVEDDALVSMSTTAILEDLGHAVVETSSGTAALAEMEGAYAFDIVITDYTMPGINGLELAEQIRTRWPGMPIVLASGQTELRDQAGLDLPRLMKPYSQDDLAKMLERLITHARAA